MTVRERYSAALTKLVILVYKEYNYPQKISQHIRVTQSPVSRQLKQVEKDGYIEGKKENLLYKTVYELNWYNLISLFYENLTQNISFNLKKQAEKEKVSVEKLIESLKENKEIDLRNYKEEIERISKDNKCNQAVHKIIETSFEVSFETNFDISLDDLYGLIYFAIISFRKNPFTGAWDKSIYRLTETEKEKRGKDVTYQIDTLHAVLKLSHCNQNCLFRCFKVL